MFKPKMNPRWLVSLCALTAGGVLYTSAVGGLAQLLPQDPMRSEALASRLATRSVLVAATRAGERLVVAGERGHILLSDDGGASWRQAKVPVSVTLTALHFVDARLGWATGHSGVILHSADGGETWQVQLDGEKALALLAAQAAGDEEMRQRIGRLVQDGPDKPFLAVHFSNANLGMAVGAYGMAFATEDGGRQWTPVLDRVDNPDERHLYAIHERSDGWYLAGEQGWVWRRPAGAERFARLPTTFQNTVFGLVSAPQGELLAFGLGGKVHRSTDQGQRWTTVETGQGGSIAAGLGMPDGVLLAGDAGQWLWSRDGGQSFSTLPREKPMPVAGLTSNGKGGLVSVGPLGIDTAPTFSVTSN